MQSSALPRSISHDQCLSRSLMGASVLARAVPEVSRTALPKTTTLSAPPNGAKTASPFPAGTGFSPPAWLRTPFTPKTPVPSNDGLDQSYYGERDRKGDGDVVTTKESAEISGLRSSANNLIRSKTLSAMYPPNRPRSNSRREDASTWQGGRRAPPVQQHPWKRDDARQIALCLRFRSPAHGQTAA